MYALALVEKLKVFCIFPLGSFRQLKRKHETFRFPLAQAFAKQKNIRRGNFSIFPRSAEHNILLHAADVLILWRNKKSGGNTTNFLFMWILLL